MAEFSFQPPTSSFSTHSDPEQEVLAATGTSLVAPSQLPLSEKGDAADLDSSQLKRQEQDSFEQIRPSEKEQSPLRQNATFFNSSDFTVTNSTFVDSDLNFPVSHYNLSTNFMKDLLKETIIGAAFDSSNRYPPPRCHPETRLSILERCLRSTTRYDEEKRMRWVFGAAGVGKSAIMQSVAETQDLLGALNASVFFSTNGRDDVTRAVMTVSYQFAVKSEVYRHVILDKVSRDPSLLYSSMPVQFKKFIVEPFRDHPHLTSAGPASVIIDGLDECHSPRIELELLHLIANFCITYPSSPLVWLVSSRPEVHIASFFSRAEVVPVYEKEEITVDSDEARRDVGQFLHQELAEIQSASNSLNSCWPDAQDLSKLVNAAGGLFVYAKTVTEYIGDPLFGSPVSRLSDVLNIIDGLPMPNVPQEQHPMAPLDALYRQTLSRVPPQIMVHTRKLLLALVSHWDSALKNFASSRNFIVLCNLLGMTADEAYAAVNHLPSVLNFPGRNEAYKRALDPWHESFIDYISRSGLSSDIKHEARQMRAKCAFRVLKEAPRDIRLDDVDYYFRYGKLDRDARTVDKISLSWPVGEGISWDNMRTRLSLYKLAVGEVTTGIQRGDPEFQTEFCTDLLATQFQHFQYVCLHSRSTRTPGRTTDDTPSPHPLTREDRLSAVFGQHIVDLALLNSHLNGARPRCHSDTREKILRKVRSCVQGADVRDRLLFIRGVAGVGKTAILQTLAKRESENRRTVATIFHEPRFSEEFKNFDRLVIPIVAYQLALQDESYANGILEVLGRRQPEPYESLQKQFDELIVEPWGMRHFEETPLEPPLVILDGLDGGGMDKESYAEIVRLISHYTSTATTERISWIISNPPELLALSTPLRATKLEIAVNSDDALEDMGEFLRNEFNAICKRFPTRVPKMWPSEDDLLCVMIAASGYFAFAASIIDFVGDPSEADPVGQLRSAIAYITGHSRDMSPFATLDRLYGNALRQASPSELSIAMRLISLFLVFSVRLSNMPPSMVVACNILRLSRDDVYPSLNQLSTLLDIPPDDFAGARPLKFLHSSFEEFLLDPARSGAHHIEFAAYRMEILRCCTSIAQQASGTPGGLESIQLTWSEGDVKQQRKNVYMFAARTLASLWEPRLL